MIQKLNRKGLIDREHMAVFGVKRGGLQRTAPIDLNIPAYSKLLYAVMQSATWWMMAEHTHKFEKYYHRFLTGRYPEEKRRFIERSPIQHIDQIQDPLSLFHGRDDHVVSTAQSQRISISFQKKKLPAN